MEQSNFDTVLNIKIEQFDGPLDVLSNLIKDRKLDIIDIDLIEIIDQYTVFFKKNLEYIKINSLVEYLYMAAFLVNLKSSKVLLLQEQTPENQNKFEYERDKLIQRIIEYKKYKSISENFESKMNKRSQMISKKQENLEGEKNIIYDEYLPEKLDVNKFVDIFNSLLKKFEFNQLKKSDMSNISEELIEDVQNDFLEYLSSEPHTSFVKYVKSIHPDRLTHSYLTSFFNIILELYKYNTIDLTQGENDIHIKHKK
ncbi:MAG: segregation/condensation protein A [Mycoplasmataceae bacterium]|jgi:segregation and condensation protein A|nr:segregation/condensation protein A [Mycoplasmataceae bacterium]